jgi:hypothetical protein
VATRQRRDPDHYRQRLAHLTALSHLTVEIHTELLDG